MPRNPEASSRPRLPRPCRQDCAPFSGFTSQQKPARRKPSGFDDRSELLILTLRKAGRIIEPGPPDAERTLTRFIAVPDDQEAVGAIDRLEKGHGLRVVK